MKKLFFIFICFFTIKAYAAHIVGGEVVYDDLGNGNYRVILKIYRNCFGGGDNFDGLSGLPNAQVTVYDGALNLINVYDFGAPSVSQVPPAFNTPCIQTPNTTCIQEGVYTKTISLPPVAGGYYLIYQRCCRSGSVLNLVNPNKIGSTYYAQIPGPETVATNSSPRFTNLPPIYVCKGRNFTFNHSATDPDGDQLVYSFCTPFEGLDACCPYVNYGSPSVNNPNCVSPPSFCPTEATLPPFSPVLFLSSYSATYPIASNPAFSINPTTGFLSGTPTMNGEWVFGICVQEFRNNQLISTHFRDFQVTVINCTATVQGIINDIGSITAVANGINPQCQGLKFDFVNQGVNQSTNPVYHWDFGVTSLTNDTSNIISPSYTFPDTGTYVVTLISNPGKACADTTKKTVYAYPPLSVKFNAPAAQCLKNNSFNFLMGGNFLPSSTVDWFFTANATPSTSTLKNPTNIVFNQSGNFIITMIGKQYACRDTFIDTVHVIPRPETKINNLPSILCDPAIVAFSNGSTSELPLKYLWQFSNGGTSTLFEPTQIFTPAGVYGVSLTAITTSVCADSNMVSITNVTVNPKPHAGFTFSPQVTSIFDPEITINNTSSSDVMYWKYFFGDGLGSAVPFEKHVYEEYGDYEIKQIVANKFGCEDTISQVVKILPEFRFWAPNAFTPDENLMNDLFLPIAIGVINYEFDIFTRWGEKIFSTKNPKQGWDGVYQGQVCKEDMYVWRVTFKNVVTQKDEVHYGHVSLLKNL